MNKIARFKWLAIGFSLSIFAPSMSSAKECVTPISIPDSRETSEWQELVALEANKNLNSDVKEVLTIKSAFGSEINLDYYAITIDAVPGMTASAFFDRFRKRLGVKIFGENTNYTLTPYNTSNGNLWNSGSPVGAVMTFVLAGYSPQLLATLRGVRIEIENGDVLVSCHSSQSFIFSTVYTEKNGYHPVSGNRGFGILDNGNGSWTLFTKGADRMSGYLGNAAEVIRQFDSDAIFKEGHKIWVQLLNNIATEYTKQKPRNQIVNSHRYPYPL